MTKILGIVSHIGTYEHKIGDEMEEALYRVFTRSRAYARKNGDLLPDYDTVHIYEEVSIPPLVSQVASAQAIILIVPANAIFSLSGFAFKLEQSFKNLGGDGLYGKWIGLIACGGDYPRAAQEGYRILSQCNAIGMMLLPEAFVHLATFEGREYLPLGANLAEILARQSEWQGHPASSQAA